MTAFTAIATGDWEDPDTWSVGSGRFPGDGVDTGGDTAAINGAYTVTYTSASAAAVAAGQGYIGTTSAAIGIQIWDNASAHLIINADIQVRDNFFCYGAGNLTVAAGVTVDLYAPTATTYSFRWDNTGASTGNFITNGTAGNRTTIRNTGAGTYYIYIIVDADVLFDWGYTDLIDIGSSSSYGLWWTSTVGQFRCDGGMQLRCGTLYGSGLGTNLDFYWNKLDIRDPDDQEVIFIATGSAIGTGTRTFNDLTVYDAATTTIVINAPGFEIDGYVTYLCSKQGRAAGTGCVWSNGVSISTSPDAFSVPINGAWEITESVILTNMINPHNIVETASYDGATTKNRYTYNIHDGFGNVAGEEGDCHIPRDNCDIQYNLIINDAGTLVTGLGSSAIVELLEHNTCHGSHGANVGEGTIGSGFLVYVRSNLAVSQNSLLTQYSAYVAQGAGFILDYNGCYSMSDASNFDIGADNGYLGPETYGNWFPTGAYGDANKGANDIYGDPGFVDSTRTAATWDTANGGAGTITNIAAEMVAKNGIDSTGAGTTFDANYSVANLKSYIRAGFAPTNTAYQGTAHDAGDVGALSVLSVSGGAANMDLFNGHQQLLSGGNKV